jgi:hypothetical protein
MGGPGSGQRPSKYSTRDCRVVSMGELLAAARRHPPGGDVIWRAKHDGQILGRLSYSVAEEHRPEGTDLRVLALRYQPTPQAPESRERLFLDPGQPALAHCPGCEQPLRKLYAPPGAAHFLCRCCHGLVYRSPPRNDDLAELQAAMGDLLHGLYADEELLAKHANYRQRDLATLINTVEEERSLDDQELRVWCLRLRKAGLSLRAIARHCGVSKSSVQRYLAAGLGGIDHLALSRERLRRYHDGQLGSLAGLPLHAQVRLLTRHVRKLGLERHSLQEREEKLVL